MGDTHWRSDLKAKDGLETISGFTNITGGTLTATTLTVNTSGTVPALTTTTTKATSYFQLGDHKYIFFGDESTEGSIVAAATAVDASVKGSLYLGAGTLWVFDADNAATIITTN